MLTAGLRREYRGIGRTGLAHGVHAAQGHERAIILRPAVSVESPSGAEVADFVEIEFGGEDALGLTVAIRSCRAYLSAFFPQFDLDDGE
ncbi:hypothetical protein EDC59_10549 [Pseudodesulfovibrio indicus]|uniref:Uncharacterized protein n=1 Tax=Pseudodesulfovibrio indicus TaxID=1716143 RepID=A0A126QQN4_9BACT|nr:hypothetical protein AWY79_13500 [Pseudodesulfovibrio indicus]TDT88648.1 hypothetical protein EDC59_10549 [Pseudodesulfovibrio indicus]